ncbi:MAG: hypothetical protein ACREQY_12075 [Candidatus Binatia bacterium]
MKPKPHKAAINPVNVGRSDPRQSWKYIQRRIHSMKYVARRMKKTSEV